MSVDARPNVIAFKTSAWLRTKARRAASCTRGIAAHQPLRAATEKASFIYINVSQRGSRAADLFIRSGTRKMTRVGKSGMALIYRHVTPRQRGGRAIWPGEAKIISA